MGSQILGVCRWTSLGGFKRNKFVSLGIAVVGADRLVDLQAHLHRTPKLHGIPEPAGDLDAGLDEIVLACRFHERCIEFPRW